MRFQEFSIPLLEGFKEALADFTDNAKEVKMSIGDIMTRARDKLEQDEITRGQYDDVMDAIKGLARQKGYSQPDNLLAIAEEYDISDDTDARELTNRLLNIES